MSNLYLACYPSAEAHLAEPNWKLTPPRQWTNKEVIDWVYHVVETWKIDPHNVHGEHFSELTGQDLCTMTLIEFEFRDSLHGHRFFECFQDLLNQGEGSEHVLLEPFHSNISPILLHIIHYHWTKHRRSSKYDLNKPSILEVTRTFRLFVLQFNLNHQAFYNNLGLKLYPQPIVTSTKYYLFPVQKLVRI